MYDRAETAAANDALWAAFVRQMPGAPSHLNRDLAPDAAWRHPDLLLSQTCGLPYSLGLHAQVQLVGAPDFRLPDCPPGTYCSAIITRRGETRATSQLLAQGAVMNERKSQSGHNALFRFAQGIGCDLGPARISGGHVASARMVAEGKADIAAIDANTWRLITRWDDWAKTLEVIARTPPTPAMPFICGPSADSAQVFDALRTALAKMSDETRDTLGLHDIVPARKEAYLAVPPPPL